jgi:hypothetical protein
MRECARVGVGRVAVTDGARREYACTFISAGRVKREDQQPSNWLIPAGVLESAAARFEGRPCYLDHPDQLDGWGARREPRVARLIGITSNVAWNEADQALTGTLRLYDAEPGSPGHLVGVLFDQILADQAQGLPVPPIGLSAVFYHTSRIDDDAGLRVTNAIHYVESVDLVYDPGAAGYIRRALAALSRDSGRARATAPDGHFTELCCPLPTTVEGPAQNLPQPSSFTYPASEGDRTMPDETTSTVECSAPAAAPAAPSPDLATLAVQIARMDAQIARLNTVLAQQAEASAIQDVPAPGVRGMRTSLDQVEIAVEAMLSGVRPAGDVAPLSGIRELYTLLSGDYDMTGRFDADRVYLANVNSSTMAGLVANALNKRVVNIYQTYPKWWGPAVTEMDFATLQAVRWITLGGIGELPTVAEGAAYTELTWDDNTETASFVKKGGYLGITIEAIDKDDTNRLRAAPRALAQGAWMTLGKTIAALFTTNTALGPALADGTAIFDAGRGNLGVSAFSHTSWVATKIAMMKYAELNSTERLAGLTKPRFVWVPVDLEDTAVAELASGEGQVGSADYNVNADALANALTDRLQRARDRVIVCPFWTDTTDWVAQADPDLYPGLGLGYRYGRTPEIFSVASPTAGLMFSNDTMPVKVRFFFATGFTDWRAWYKHVVA